MIKNILFDLGNVLIPLDEEHSKERLYEIFALEPKQEVPSVLQSIMDKYELGIISTDEFLDSTLKYTKEGTSVLDIKDAWNSILTGIYPGVIPMLSELSESYHLFILSNTNEMHIEWVDKLLLKTLKFPSFYEHFTHIYFSHEINLRKPDLEAFSYVCEHARIRPYETIFFDDKTENTLAADSLGFTTSRVRPGELISTLVKDLGLI